MIKFFKSFNINNISQFDILFNDYFLVYIQNCVVFF